MPAACSQALALSWPVGDWGRWRGGCRNPHVFGKLSAACDCCLFRQSCLFAAELLDLDLSAAQRLYRFP